MNLGYLQRSRLPERMVVVCGTLNSTQLHPGFFAKAFAQICAADANWRQWQLARVTPFGVIGVLSVKV